jgi:hypothetical protein
MVACATSKPVAVAPSAARISDICARVQCVARAAADVKVVDGKLVAGGKELTPAFKAIQSFDVSLERREIVFSARRSDNFDIGLVSLDGSDIHWIPEDPSDETDVQWAPRGNKVSYVVHTRVGEVVRTVHIPTATQLSVVFPYATIRAVAWDSAAERYSVLLSSPDASDRIESVKYNGEGHRVDVPPEVSLNVATGPIGGALVLRPASIRYGEKVPLVVWISDPPYRWNDARAMLLSNSRVACAIMRSVPDAAFWSAVDETPWIDGKRVYVMGGRSERGIQVPHAEVESSAALWIAKQLKDSNGVR